MEHLGRSSTRSSRVIQVIQRTIDVPRLHYELPVQASTKLSPTLEVEIWTHLKAHLHLPLFHYVAYWRYEFTVESETVVTPHGSFKYRGVYGGKPELIAHTRPEDLTITDFAYTQRLTLVVLSDNQHDTNGTEP